MLSADVLKLFAKDGAEFRLGASGCDSWKTTKNISARQDLATEGESPRTVSLLVSGWGCRYKQLSDGRRHLISVVLPGELCDHSVSNIGPLDHSIAAITSMTLAQLPRAEFDRHSARAELMSAIWTEDLLREARTRERLVSLGTRNATERLAHFLCAIFVRLQHIGECEGKQCRLPLTQSDISDLNGITAVHVNRTLQELRKRGLIELSRGKLVIPDFQALADVGEFDPAYLRLPLP